MNPHPWLEVHVIYIYIYIPRMGDMTYKPRNCLQDCSYWVYD